MEPVHSLNEPPNTDEPHTPRPTRDTTSQRLARITGWVGVVSRWDRACGRSSLRAPFYDNIVMFEPYNRHLLHDIGASTLGLGAGMLVASSPTRAWCGSR
jgi:hypothetical protein